MLTSRGCFRTGCDADLTAVIVAFSAYSFCNQHDIGEQVYRTGWDFDKLNDSMQWMTDEMITKLTPDILKDR